MIRRTAALTAALALAVPACALATAAEASAAPTKFSNCDQLTRYYPHGVAKSNAAAMKQVRAGYGKPATSAKAKKVYAANKASLDRDKDGTACER